MHVVHVGGQVALS